MNGLPELHDWLKAYLKRHPHATHRELADATWGFSKKHPTTLKRLVENWVECHRPRYEVHTAPGSVAVLRKERAIAEAPASSRSIEREATRTVLEHAGTIFMNLPLPDGTVLRDATFAQCKRAGGWLLLVAKQGLPSEVVGRKLSEKNLQDLWARGHKG